MIPEFDSSTATIDEVRFNEELEKLIKSSEIRYAFHSSIQTPSWHEVKDQGPPMTMLLSDFFDLQEKAKNKILSIVPDLYAITSDGQDIIEKTLVRDLALLAASGTITFGEIDKLFEYSRLAWGEYWDESEFNYRVHSIFEPPKIINRHPYEKFLTLDNAYYQAGLCRQDGKRVVAVMGTFDFHDGHADLFEAARELAGGGLVFAFLTSDEEASRTRPGQSILKIKQRLEVLSGNQGLDFCIPLPWEKNYDDPLAFDLHMRDLHRLLGAHFRLTGEPDERSNLMEAQCAAAGTRLIYRSNKRLGGSATEYREKLARKDR